MAKSPCLHISLRTGKVYSEAEYKASLVKELPEILDKLPEFKEKYDALAGKMAAENKTTVQKAKKQLIEATQHIRENRKKRASSLDAANTQKKFNKEMKDFQPANITEFVQHWLATGGKINSKEYADRIHGEKSTEYKEQAWVHDKDAKNLDTQALDLAESWKHEHGDENLDTEEIKGIIDEQINKYATKQDIQTDLLRTHEERKFMEENNGMTRAQTEEAQALYEEQQRLIEHYGLDKAEEELAHQALDEAEGKVLSQDEVEALAKEYDQSEQAKQLYGEEINQGGKGEEDASNKGVGEGKTIPDLEQAVTDKEAGVKAVEKEIAPLEKGLAKFHKDTELDTEGKPKQLDAFAQATKKDLTDKIEALQPKLNAAKSELETAKNELKQAQDREVKAQQEAAGQTNIFDGLKEFENAAPGGLMLAGQVDKAVTAIAKIAKGLIQTGAATIKNIMEKVKDYLANKFPSFKMTKEIEEGLKTELDQDEHDLPTEADMILAGKTDAEIDAELEKRKMTLDKIKDVLSKQKDSTKLSDRIKDSGAVKWAKSVVQAVSPFSLDPSGISRDAATIIRGAKGEEARQLEIIDEANKGLLQFWNTIPKAERYAFMLSIENPGKFGEQTPEFKAMAETYRARLDKAFDMIKDIKDLPYIEDYFPHFWEDPKKAGAVLNKINAKRPLEGGKSFLKKRFYSDILQGTEAGLRLATDNPEEMVRLAETNAYKFKTAHDIFDSMHKEGLLKYAKAGEQPEGWQAVDDPIFKRLGLFTTKEGDPGLAIGNYYMPEEAARIVNNYLSPGILSGPLGAVRQWNNLKNLVQLAFGLFHFTTTSIDATVTGVGNAIQELTAGKALSGTKDLVEAMSIIPNLTRTLLRGDQAIKARREGLDTPDVQALTKANGNTGLAKIYSTDTHYQLQKAFSLMRTDKDFSQIPNIIKNSLFVVPELLGKPLMEWYVPHLKVGGFLRSWERELAVNPNMTPRERDIALQKTWDDQDNRLGQVVYDNLFWNKTIKDLGFLSIRSMGWTGGTIKALGGGALDVPTSGKRLIEGKGLTQRTAWAIALPMMVGAMGAAYGYMMTGKKPKTANDYFFPEDGTLNPDGTPHRVSMPSYMKDVLAYQKHPMQTLMRKTAPAVNEAYELYSNKDFYGTQIYNSEDPAYQKGIDILKYEAESFVPFSFKQKTGEEKSLLDQLTSRQGLEQKFGLMSAPKEMERTEMEQKITTEAAKNFGEKSYTKAEQEKSSARKHIRELIHAGNGWGDIPKEMKDKAEIKPEGVHTFITEAKLNPYERVFKHLQAPQKIKLFEQMSDSEKEIYKKYMPKHKRKAGKPDGEGDEVSAEEPVGTEAE